MSTICYADELAAQAYAESGADYNARRAYVEQEAMKDTPTYLGIIHSVVYSDKTDRYVLKFEAGSAKTTHDVAAFLLTHAFSRAARPTVYAHMTEGSVDDVTLLFVSRS
jgi:hypothetical protein